MRGSFACLFALAAACTESHPANQQRVMGDDCGKCHGEAFNHPEENFPRLTGAHQGVKCLVCHDIDVISPTATTPEDSFKLGFNTNCIQCHPNDAHQQASHLGARSEQGVVYEYRTDVPNFCLQCHPKGQARKHPQDKFPLSGHHDVACNRCHLYEDGPNTGGGNTSCIESGCHHTLSWSDNHDEHRQRQSYWDARGGMGATPVTKHFCLVCHKGGGGGGD